MDYLNFYVNFLNKFRRPKRQLKVVFDCSNGTTGLAIKKLFLGQKFINEKIDGRFPGHGPNPMAPGATNQLEKAVLKQKADLGVIFDADGDRVFFVDDRGRLISPDETGYMLLQELKPKKYVVSVISGWLLKRNVPSSKFQVSRVGHYFFKKLMRKKRITLGMEHSGHYYFGFPKENFYFDSGILAAIQVINFVSKLNQPISEYLNKLPKYYQSREINFELKNKSEKLKNIEKYFKKQKAKISKLDGLTVEFKDWQVNLRSSNTENLLRLNIESVSEKILRNKLKEIKKLVNSHK